MSSYAPAAIVAFNAPRAAAYRVLIDAILFLDRRVAPLWQSPALSRRTFAHEVQRRYTINCLRELRDLLRDWQRQAPSTDMQAWPDRFTAAEISSIALSTWREAHEARGWCGCRLLARTLS